MKATKKLFIGLLITLGLLFLLACVSIIFTFVIDFQNTSENIMATVFLFVHIIVLSIAFYLTFKALLYKSALMSVFMIDEHGHPIKKSFIVCVVLSSLGFVIGVYFTLLVFKLSMPLDFFATGLKYAIMNVGYSLCFVALFFALYPTCYLKELECSKKE